jgi:hypothetical protein
MLLRRLAVLKLNLLLNSKQPAQQPPAAQTQSTVYIQEATAATEATATTLNGLLSRWKVDRLNDSLSESAQVYLKLPTWCLQALTCSVCDGRNLSLPQIDPEASRTTEPPALDSLSGMPLVANVTQLCFCVSCVIFICVMHFQNHTFNI